MKESMFEWIKCVSIISEDKWCNLKTTIPIRLACCGCVPVLKNQYVLLLGGLTDGAKGCNDIWIYNVKTKSFQKSKIKTPQNLQLRMKRKINWQYLDMSGWSGKHQTLVFIYLLLNIL